jgi:hypothetical protein
MHPLNYVGITYKQPPFQLHQRVAPNAALNLQATNAYVFDCSCSALCMHLLVSSTLRSA